MTDSTAACPHEQATGTYGVIRCPRCGAVMADNGVRIVLTEAQDGR